MAFIIHIERKVAEGFRFDLNDLQTCKELKQSGLYAGQDYEFGFVKGSEFPSVIIVLDRNKVVEADLLYCRLQDKFLY